MRAFAASGLLALKAKLLILGLGSFSKSLVALDGTHTESKGSFCQSWTSSPSVRPSSSESGSSGSVPSSSSSTSVSPSSSQSAKSSTVSSASLGWGCDGRRGAPGAPAGHRGACCCGGSSTSTAWRGRRARISLRRSKRRRKREQYQCHCLCQTRAGDKVRLERSEHCEQAQYLAHRDSSDRGRQAHDWGGGHPRSSVAHLAQGVASDWYIDGWGVAESLGSTGMG